MSKPAQALPSSLSGRAIIKHDDSVARLPLEAFTHQDVMPGDLIMVSNALIVPVLPSSSLAGGEISIPQPLAAQFDIKAGDDVPYERAPNGAVPTPAHSGAEGICFGDIGGLGPELARLREMVELPLIRPDLFAHLGITPPRGVLMSGPPGCGKTLIARALAAETKAAFFSIAGPEIADKHFGASEARLRDVFEAASAAAPAILFFDEIDSIAPAREGLSGDKQAERRMVAQLLTLMDGLDARGDVVVLAATNLPDLIDPALRRPGRFDREIILAAPDAKGRGDILAIHTKAMPLANDVELSDIARRCHGFVGADLASLAREAGIAALRRAPGGDVASLYVTRADFDAAFAEVRPSTLRAVQLDVPATTWDDIAGASKAKAALRQALEWPLAYRVHYAQLGLSAPNGILLYGPPGTGKTLLARALANAAEANFIAINAGELLSLYLGESERAIRSVFARARASAPTVLFFDELDALAPRRSAQLSETASRVVAQLLTEMDGLTKGSGLFILGATNRMDQIDPAVLRPGRFDQKIEVPLPNATDRAELLSLYLKGVAREQVDLEAL
ncbi:MAG: AAA family ATPase, partial [Pseudomonadota bacterium]